MVRLNQAARAARVALAIMVVLVTAACPASQSPRCKDICRRMAVCSETLGKQDITIDVSECTAACTGLERDEKGKLQVDKQVECVTGARDCEAMTACF
jgi:hypothetical protein